jgi:hypothetical protein
MGNNILNNPQRPRMLAYLNTGVTNVTGNAATYTVIFDTVAFGTGYSTINGIYTTFRPGNYFIACSLDLNNLTSGANGNQCAISANLNSYRLFECGLNSSKSSNNIFTCSGSIIYNLASSQSISITATVNNASSNLVGISGGNSPYVSWLYIAQIS